MRRLIKRLTRYSLLLALSFQLQPVFAGASSIKEGDKLPPFMLPVYNQSGKYAAMRDYCGEPRPTKPNEMRRILVLSFFSHTCIPCKNEIPILGQLAEEWGEAAKVFLISVGDKPDEIKKWLTETPTDLQILMDPYKATSVERYGVTSLPTLYVLDCNGIVRYVHTGYMEGDEKLLDEVIRGLLAQ